MVNLHPRYLCSLFKKATGQNISEFIKNCRINRAKRLFIYTSLSITEIAYECGFGSSQYFSRVFRRDTGLEPRAFRSGNRD